MRRPRARPLLEPRAGMNGYIAVAVRRRRANYWAEFPALPGCGGSGATADAALDAAGRVLDRYAAWLARQGRRLPPPSPSWTLIAEARRRGAVAAACLRPRPPAATELKRGDR